MASRGETRAAWLSKSLAGLVLGFGLALAGTGLFAWLGPGGVDAPNKFQVNMWLLPPLWVAVLATVFLFHTATRAWVCLGAATGIAHVALWACRTWLS